MDKLSYLMALKLPGGEQIEATELPQGGLDKAQVIIRNGLTIFIIIAIVLAIIFFIWAGINWITAAGDKQKLQAARNKLTYAIVGLVVVFFAFFIISLIGYLYRVPIEGK